MTTKLPMTIDPALLEALGRLVTEFNALELWLSIMIGVLLGVRDQEIAHIVTAKLLFGPKLEMFQALLDHREPKQAASTEQAGQAPGDDRQHQKRARARALERGEPAG